MYACRLEETHTHMCTHASVHTHERNTQCVREREREREREKWCIHSKRLEKPHTRTHPPEKCSESVQRLRHSALPSRLRAPPSNPLPTLRLSRHPKSLAPLRSKVAHLSFLPLIPLYFLSSPPPTPPLFSRPPLLSHSLSLFLSLSLSLCPPWTPWLRCTLHPSPFPPPS